MAVLFHSAKIRPCWVLLAEAAIELSRSLGSLVLGPFDDVLDVENADGLGYTAHKIGLTRWESITRRLGNMMGYTTPF